ncbi:alanine--tRNA ligase [Planctomycetota bacterium]
MLDAKQIRSGFIDFFKDKGHDFVSSSPLVPINDPTLLFINAGMNQFKDIFMGLSTASYTRAANSQKCLRVSGKHNDLEEVGKDTYHHTFFEMLGNWSFGDYFKAEAIEWAWQLLTEVWGIDADKLWATYFAGDKADGMAADEEAAKIWTKATPIPAERVLACGKKDNFWEMGVTGPCGPCSEIHIDLGPDRCDMKNVLGHKCAVNAGCSRFIELWNLVFIQYNRDETGRLTPLKAKHVDTGAGLERIVAVMQNKTSNYDTDLFMPIINHLSEMTGHRYTSQLGNKTDNAFRVVADHIRALVFAITDGAAPSNEGRGYVIRRILRRASRFGREFDMHEPFMHKLVPVVTDYMGQAFPEIIERADYVSMVIKAEEESFGRTLDRGIEIFNTAAERTQKANTKTIDGEDAFQLYDTFGFPLDLTQLMAKERGLDVDIEKFKELMTQQRQRARAAQKDNSGLAVLTNVELPVTEDLHKYHTDSCESKILGWIDTEGFKTRGKLNVDDQVAVVLDKTCFYAESGGQIGDCGSIKTGDCLFVVDDTAKIADCVIHKGKLQQGTLAVGDKVTATVSKDRNSIKKNHTATHLLQWALQQVLGDSVAQQGSLVCTDYLRFDFTHPKGLTTEQTKEIEKLVTEKIIADEPVHCKVMPRGKADKLGAMALFGEKYGSEVRVVAIGAATDEEIPAAFSAEFCGGTHLDRLGSISGFKIIKEESISAGVRRITALTGQALSEYLEKRSDAVDILSELLKVPADEIVDRVGKLIKDNKKLAKELKSTAKQKGSDVMTEARELLGKCEKINDSAIVTSVLENTSIDQARQAIDMIKKKAKSAAVVFGFADGDKVTLLSGVTDDLIKKGLKAGDIIKKIAPIVDGGGGGRPQMAQAGGKNPAKLKEAIKKANELIKQKLAEK